MFKYSHVFFFNLPRGDHLWSGHDLCWFGIVGMIHLENVPANQGRQKKIVEKNRGKPSNQWASTPPFSTNGPPLVTKWSSVSSSLFRCQTCVAFETIFGGFEASEGSEWCFSGIMCAGVTNVPPPPPKNGGSLVLENSIFGCFFQWTDWCSLMILPDQNGTTELLLYYYFFASNWVRWCFKQV